MTFVIQVLGGNKSSTEQLNTHQSMIVFSLLEGIKIDVGEIIYKDLLTKLSGKSRQKLMSYPRFISCVLQDLLALSTSGRMRWASSLRFCTRQITHATHWR